MLLELIMEGRLKWKGYINGNHRFDGLLFDSREILRATKKKVKRRGVARKATSRALGVSLRTIHPLIDMGELTTVIEYNTYARRREEMIAPDSINRFLQQYVTLGDVGRMWGVHPQQALNDLKRLSIEEVFPNEARHTMIFRREDVPMERTVVPKRIRVRRPRARPT